MAKKGNGKLMAGYVVLSLVAIAVLAALALKKKHCKCENFDRCICSGGGKVCNNVDSTEAAYRMGMISENQDFGAIQKADGGPKWSTYSPGDMNITYNRGCN